MFMEARVKPRVVLLAGVITYRRWIALVLLGQLSYGRNATTVFSWYAFTFGAAPDGVIAAFMLKGSCILRSMILMYTTSDGEAFSHRGCNTICIATHLQVNCKTRIPRPAPQRFSKGLGGYHQRVKNVFLQPCVGMWPMR